MPPADASIRVANVRPGPLEASPFVAQPPRLHDGC